MTFLDMLVSWLICILYTWMHILFQVQRHLIQPDSWIKLASSSTRNTVFHFAQVQYFYYWGGGLHIRNHPSACVDLICLHQEIFTFGALEARVRRTSSFLAPVGKCFSCRPMVCVKKEGSLYLLYTQPKYPFITL